MKMKSITTPLAVIVMVAACGSEMGSGLDVRTFELQYLEVEAAARIVDPYVFGDQGSMISIDDHTRTLTIRETPAMLERIEVVLKEFDRPEPTVSLKVQIIEADGNASPDPAIADVEEALRGLFRFEGYELIAEALVRGSSWTEFSQRVAGSGEGYLVEGRFGEARVAGEGGTVGLDVRLISLDHGEVFQTAVRVTLGQTMVLGTAQPDPRGGALILTVKVDLDSP